MIDLKDNPDNRRDAAPLTHALLARKGQAVSAARGAEATPVRDFAETARNEAATPADSVEVGTHSETAPASLTLPKKAIFAGVAFLVIGSVAVGYFLSPQTIPGNTQSVETQAALDVTETAQPPVEAALQGNKAPEDTEAQPAPEQVSPAAGVSTTTDVAVALGSADKPETPTTSVVAETAKAADRKESQGLLDKQPVAAAAKAVVQQTAAVEPDQVKPLKTPPPAESVVAEKDKAIVPTPYADARQNSKELVERSAAAQSLPPIPSPRAITPPSAPAAVPAPAIVDAAKPVKEAPPPAAIITAPKPRPKAVKPTVQTARRPVPPKRTVPRAATTSAYFVQLVSVKSQNAADREWGRLSKRFINLFNGLKPSIQKASVAGKGTFYRLRAAGFDTQGKARDLCRKLKAAKQSCLVVRR